jgi:hypothetical protein
MTINYPPRKRDRDVSTQRGIQNRDVNAAQRAKEALKLRAQMLTYDEIATRCGYATRDAARKAILREMDRTIVRNVDELRDAELHMLNIMHSECWQLFMDKSNQWRYAEVERLLRISERRCKLMGLDTPIDQTINQNFTVVREVPMGYLGTVEAQPT